METLSDTARKCYVKNWLKLNGFVGLYVGYMVFVDHVERFELPPPAVATRITEPGVLEFTPAEVTAAGEEVVVERAKRNREKALT